MVTTKQVLGGNVSISLVATGRSRETEGETEDKSQKILEKQSCEATGPSTPSNLGCYATLVSTYTYNNFTVLYAQSILLNSTWHTT